MRIQHNIAALNSYRNLTNNNSSVSKNLEKLSSGYRINRAGDDAAGLAISEKMRAQITGLETAQKNAQDGISLVQTAEGAMTEIHSMLNRMVELADQSANGTYDNNTDRAQIQKEVQSLKDEIDRISKGTNFNGINLLDGSLGGGGAKLTDIETAIGKDFGSVGLAGGTAANNFQTTSWTGINGANGNYTITTGTASGTGFTAGAATTDRDILISRSFTDADGNTTTENFLLNLDDIMSAVNADGETKTVGGAAGKDINVSADGDVYTLDLSAAGLGKIQIQATGAGADTDIIGALNGASAEITDSNGGGGLTLQIGDTADDFNQLNVSIGDMSSRSLGLNTVDVSTQATAKAAVKTIKDAINSVSGTRGDLGAIQNRLEHTINNLSVTSENMTAAESRIRDVDMAKEMMTYTKNNILVQASQAMLAQANQIPQGVLQLLQ